MAADTLTDSGVVPFADGLKQLEKLRYFILNLNSARNLTDQALKMLVGNPAPRAHQRNLQEYYQK
eukprot:2836593-Amphidinium_carterae.1